METSSEIQEKLDQSIRLLNRQNAQRKTFLRLSGKSTTPKRISLQTTGQLRKDADDSRLDDAREIDIDSSLTLAPHEIRDIMARSEMNDITIREMMENSTVTGAILRANEPWREAKAKLYYDFLQSMQTHFSEAQVFDIIADFIQNCTDTLDIIRGINKYTRSFIISCLYFVILYYFVMLYCVDRC